MEFDFYYVSFLSILPSAMGNAQPQQSFGNMPIRVEKGSFFTANDIMRLARQQAPYTQLMVLGWSAFPGEEEMDAFLPPQVPVEKGPQLVTPSNRDIRRINETKQA